jgi:hypothetical protein
VASSLLLLSLAILLIILRSREDIPQLHLVLNTNVFPGIYSIYNELFHFIQLVEVMATFFILTKNIVI